MPKSIDDIIREIRDIELAMFKKWIDPKTIFTTAFYGVFLFLIIKKMPVPDDLKMMVSTLFGFWFGKTTTPAATTKPDDKPKDGGSQ